MSYNNKVKNKKLQFSLTSNKNESFRVFRFVFAVYMTYKAFSVLKEQGDIFLCLISGGLLAASMASCSKYLLR